MEYSTIEGSPMAKMFGTPDSSDPKSEHQLFESLSRLPDSWRVFYSVAWQAPKGKYMSDGETDFVLLHKDLGLYIVEVKGGEIRREGSTWTTTNASGSFEIKDPFEQAKVGKYALCDYVAAKSHSGVKPFAGHGVCFPSVEVTREFGPEAPRSIIWDRRDLEDPEAAVERLCKHWNGTSTFNAAEVESIERALAPTRSAQRRLAHVVEEVVEDIVDLTEQQVRGMSMLRKQRRALITGGAGTGKTILAVERARQLAEDGNRVLLLCFNRPLGDQFAVTFAGNDLVTAGSVHRWGRELLQSAGLLPSGKLPEDYFEAKMPSLVPSAATGEPWDALVIDEGQDFSGLWFLALQLCLADSSHSIVNVFADANQNIYRTDWEPPFEADPVMLDVNCRNTNQITERVNATIGLDSEALGADGPNPRWHHSNSAEEAVGIVLSRCQELIKSEGVRPDQLAVLATERWLIDQLRQRTVAGHPLVPSDETGVTAETVHRFKGLEAEVVLLLAPRVIDNFDRLAYVGMSRAKAVLEVVGPTSAAEALGWVS